MPSYLAYQFDLDSIPDSKLIQIMDDYFDFELYREGKFKTAREWIEAEKEYLVSSWKKFLYDRNFRDIRLTDIFANSGEMGIFSIKNHPLLDMVFKYKKDKGPYTPTNNFSGLTIATFHSGSEGLVKLLEFKPEMSAYLHSIGIDYEDLSKTNQ